YGLRCESVMRELPPWWHVYPEAVLGARGKKDGERYLAVCRCGAIATPESLGWMGDTCGPCFDRQADGYPSAGGYGQFGGVPRYVVRFAYTADSRQLIGQNLAGQIWKVDRDDGWTETTRRKMVSTIG